MKSYQWAVVSALLIAAVLTGIYLGRTFFPLPATTTNPVTYYIPQKSQLNQSATTTNVERVESTITSTVHSQRLQDIQRAEGMSVEELVATILDLTSNPNDRRSSASRIGIYMDSLVALDPAEALDSFRGSLERGLRYQLFRSWLEQDFEEAADYFIANPTEKALGDLLLNSSYISDSAYSNAIVAAYGNGAQEKLERQQIMNMDPLQALDILVSKKRLNRDRYSVISQIASRIPSESIAVALDRAKEIKDSNMRKYFYRALLSKVTQENPQQTFEMLMQMFQDHDDKKLVMESFVASAPPSADQLILNYARDNQDHTMLVNYATRIAKTDLPKALAIYMEIPSTSIPRNELHQFAGSIVDGDPGEVYDWLRQLPSSDLAMKQAVLMNMGYRHAEFLEQKLHDETDEQMRSGILSIVIRQVAENEPLNAIELIEEYSDENSRFVLTQQVVSRWAREKPREMIGYALQNRDNEELTRLVNQAARSWYRKEPEAALEYINRMEDEEVRARAQYGLVNAMIKQDPDGAVVLANSLPGKYRERARYELTIGLIRSHRSEMEKILQGMQLDPETEERVRVYVETNM